MYNKWYNVRRERKSAAQSLLGNWRLEALDMETVVRANIGSDGDDVAPGSAYHEYNPGDVAWLLACTAVTWLMIPGVGFFYNGLARSKSSLILITLCFYSVAVVSIQVRNV